MAKKIKEPVIPVDALVPVDALEFSDDLSDEQMGIIGENFERYNEARLGVPGAGFKAKIQTQLEIAKQWQSDMTKSKAVRDLARQFQELAEKSAAYVADQKLEGAMEFGLNLATAWERFGFQTGPYAESDVPPSSVAQGFGVFRHCNGLIGQLLCVLGGSIQIFVVRREDRQGIDGESPLR